MSAASFLVSPSAKAALELPWWMNVYEGLDLEIDLRVVQGAPISEVDDFPQQLLDVIAFARQHPDCVATCWADNTSVEIGPLRDDGAGNGVAPRDGWTITKADKG